MYFRGWWAWPQRALPKKPSSQRRLGPSPYSITLDFRAHKFSRIMGGLGPSRRWDDDR